MGKEKKEELIAVFTENGVLLDLEESRGKSCYTNDRLMAGFRSDPYKSLLHFGFDERSQDMSPSISFLHEAASFFIEKLSKSPDLEISRSAPALEPDEAETLLLKRPYAVGAEFLNQDWIFWLWDRLALAFKEELADYDGSVEQYLLACNSHLNIAGRVFFHLVENKSDQSQYPFAFLATYSRKASEKGVGKAEHVPLQNALLEYKENQTLLLQLLSTVSRAADRSAFISELVESGELFSPLQFTATEAYTFLREIPLYEESGIMCRIPDWWKKKYERFKVSVTIGNRPPSQVGLDALLSFEPELCIGGEKISREEIEGLLTQTAGLSMLKGRWIEVDHERLRETLEAFDRINKMADSGITLGEIVRMQLGTGSKDTLIDEDTVELSNGEWLNDLQSRLLTPEKLENLTVGEDFKAVLRPYQQAGVDWLATMKQLGFGALLADDMGLGKTVQILALLEYLRRNETCKTLLVVPASLIGNWEKELERFAPKLRYSVLHGKNAQDWPENADVYITTYGMAVRLEELNEQVWDLIVLDEAQAVKNPASKQTKAIKALPSRFRIAMTGTPVENHLSDLWSLSDFLNAGLLGTAKEFSDYTKKLQSSGSYAKLRNTISPFILRRLKTDRSIIKDLPDKLEMKDYAALSKKQIVLYQTLVKDLSKSLNQAEGIERKGVVLASLMKFKQICNHPDQYLGQNIFDKAHSGKFELLGEICETIREKRERVLVFTQFREMCEPLSEYLEAVMGRKGLILHGGTPAKKRTELVDQFNGDDFVPYMVLSLKAGGVGLNLTAANHVIHFDRWWNPAVENQATDRAFRIGQKKNVIVHKFVTTGTVEEKIDKMIEDKMKLSDELIESSGENWITEMDSDELIRLFSLEV